MRLEEEIKQKEFTNEYNKGVINIIYTANWLEERMRVFFKDYDLTSQQYNILRILRGQHPKPATINLLRDRMLDKMCDASRMVERLRLKDLVLRAVSSEDRRAVDIHISQKGLDLLLIIDKKLPHFESILKELNAQEIKQLNKLLDKLRGGLQEKQA